MKIIFGLGNIGKEYELTRHNIGFMLVDYLFKKVFEVQTNWSEKNNGLFAETNVHGERVLFVKPTTYMNDSGKCVSFFVKFYKISPSDILIIHDDLDIHLGSFKLQVSKGPKEHNGILSIENSLGYNNFYRLRVGIENRKDNRFSGVDYVLGKFTKDELVVLENVFESCSETIMEKWIGAGKIGFTK